MKKILLALHGGTTAEGAVEVARLLSGRTGATLEAIAVLEPLPVYDYGFGPVFTPEPTAEERLLEELRRDVESQLARHDLSGIELSVLRGPRAATISSIAKARDANLIVVGIGPHHLADRALGGETALHLAQGASTPVFAVPAGMRVLPSRILVAMDFSPPSLAAARFAARLAAPGSTIELAHISAPARVGGVVLGPTRSEGASRRLEALTEEISAASRVRVVCSVHVGDPARAVLGAASRHHAQLIALGSHGYSGWQRLVLGSVSSKVLRLAECAVLVYPARCATALSAGEESAMATAAST